MRDAFADEITKLAQKIPEIVLLSGDIGNRMFDKFKQNCPKRFYNCGIAESNMMSVASGLALNNLRPVVYTITPFTTTRCLEQIKIGVCYHEAPVIIVGTGSGLCYSTLGPTHHSLEDIAILRAMPGIIVFTPSDATELRCGLRAAFAQSAPVYIRLGKKGEPKIFDNEFELSFGKALDVKEGLDVCLIGSGGIMSEVVNAGRKLEMAGISTRIIHLNTIKPLDTEMLDQVFKRYELVGVVEEHNIIGGLNSAIAEWKSNQQLDTKGMMLSFATRDEFLHAIGSQEYARKFFGIDSETIFKRMQSEFCKMRSS